MSWMASSTVASSRWKRSTSTGGVGQIGEEAEVAPIGEKGLLGGVSQAGAAHDQPPAAVVGLGHLGDAIGGVGDPRPSGLVDAGNGLGHGELAHRTAMV